MFRKEVDIRVEVEGCYLRRGNFFSHRPPSLFSRLVKPATSDLCHLSLSSLLATLYEESTIGTGRQQDFTRRKVSKEIRSLLELTIAIFLPCFRFHRVYRRNIFLFLNVLSRYSYFYPFESNQSNK